jgi:hypothetical protein
MSVHGVLAMCLAALLCWLMQGHGPQMQQLRYNTWQACLGQMTLNIKHSGGTADAGICCYASLSLALQAGPALLDVLRLFFLTTNFPVSFVQYFCLHVAGHVFAAQGISSVMLAALHQTHIQWGL